MDMNSTQPVGWVGVDGDNRVLVENVDNVQPVTPPGFLPAPPVTLDSLILEGYLRSRD